MRMALSSDSTRQTRGEEEGKPMFKKRGVGICVPWEGGCAPWGQWVHDGLPWQGHWDRKPHPTPSLPASIACPHCMIQCRFYSSVSLLLIIWVQCSTPTHTTLHLSHFLNHGSKFCANLGLVFFRLRRWRYWIYFYVVILYFWDHMYKVSECVCMYYFGMNAAF
jgi:hypothetical protein